MRFHGRLPFAVVCLGVLAMGKATACSSEDPNGGGSSGTSGTSGGTSGTSGGTSGTSGGTSGTSGGPLPADDGLVPTTSTWRTTMEWYRPIDTAPVAENSQEMINALAQWGTSGDFQIDFSFNVLDGAGAPKVTFPLEGEADDVPVPVPAKGYIEGDHDYDACPDGDDCHLIVIDGMKLFEVYQAHKNGASWEGYVAFWQLDKKYPQGNRGQGCTSAEAAGNAITAGLIGYKETKKGAINHALRYIQRNQFIRGAAGDKNTPNVAYPASHGTTAGESANGIPYGGRLRLKKTISDTDPRLKTPGSKVLVRALQKYGMILADGGNIPLSAESVKVHQDANPAETWDELLGPRDIAFIKPSDFEVIAIPKNDPSGAEGWYQTKAEYVGALKKPFGCQGIVQP